MNNKQDLQYLLKNRGELDLKLKQTFSSYAFCKFIFYDDINQESMPSELEIWFKTECSDVYKKHLKEQIVELMCFNFGKQISQSYVLESKTNLFCIVFPTEVEELCL